MGSVKVVSVVNDYTVFERCIKNNPCLQEFDITVFDNCKENIGIPKRYNSFIESLKQGDDFWILFIHQDFIFNENPLKKLENLDKACVYGVVGMAMPRFYLQFSPEFIFRLGQRCMFGQIYEGEALRLVGHKVGRKCQPVVKTLDCCCCMVHSELLRENNLRFDENLDFHMYVEDFCLTAAEFGIKSRVVQMDCRHLSGGKYGPELKESADYLKKKHNISRICSTCFE